MFGESEKPEQINFDVEGTDFNLPGWKPGQVLSPDGEDLFRDLAGGGHFDFGRQQ